VREHEDRQADRNIVNLIAGRPIIRRNAEETLQLYEEE
jgi:hypothetical protein